MISENELRIHYFSSGHPTGLTAALYLKMETSPHFLFQTHPVLIKNSTQPVPNLFNK